MTIVMEMSTDADIRATLLNAVWPGPITRYTYEQIQLMNLNIADGATIVVVAHGNANEIGNAIPNTVDINADVFVTLVQENMAPDAAPTSIYISTCGTGIAQYAAHVRLIATNTNHIWNDTAIYGHCDPVAGQVPPPGDIRWTQIFP